MGLYSLAVLLPRLILPRDIVYVVGKDAGLLVLVVGDKCGCWRGTQFRIVELVDVDLAESETQGRLNDAQESRHV